MKKLVCWVLLLLCLTSTAFSAPKTIDLETMTTEELTILQGEIDARLQLLSMPDEDGYLAVGNYDDYARNPDDHTAESIKFNGKIIQVIEGEGVSDYRIAFQGDSSKMFYVTYTPDLGAPRLLENDLVTVYGLFSGLTSYQSALGGQITIPGCIAMSIIPQVPLTAEDVPYPATRKAPAPIGATIQYKGTSYYNQATMDITLVKVVRGDAAWKLVKKANQYNDEPEKGKEYVLASFKVHIVKAPDDKPVDISSYDFVAVSATGIKYERASIVPPKPEFTPLYEGAELEAYVPFLIDSGDKALFVYLETSDTPMWFTPWERATPELPEDMPVNPLKPGDKGDEVLAMQQILFELGMLSSEPDGEYGNKTKQAVAKYQLAMGKEATGIADEDTLRMILSGQAPQ